MRCPKCGSEKIVTRYHDERCGTYQPCDGARWHIQAPEPFYITEHLGRRCEVCLYAWATPVAATAVSGVQKPTVTQL